MRHGLGHVGAHLGFLADICSHGFGLTTGLANKLGRLMHRIIEVHREHLRAFLRKQQRRSAANPAACPGDDGSFA
jgi:hypothetical protein